MNLIGCMRLLEPEHYELRDMTPAQIARRHGATVADYIVELRASDELWRTLFAHARDTTIEQAAADPRDPCDGYDIK